MSNPAPHQTVSDGTNPGRSASPKKARPATAPVVVPVSAMLVMGISSVVLIGWALDNAVLKSVVPGMTTMKVNTAVELMLLAVALLAAGTGGRVGRWVAVGAIGVISVLCLLTAAEYAFGVDLKIDNALFLDRVSAKFPGRNAPATITSFLVTGLALLMLTYRRGVAAAQVMLILVLGVPLATLAGYLYRAPGMYASVGYPVIALNTAVALVILCAGAFWLRPREGLMRLVSSRTGAGMLTRRMLMLSLGVPLGVGILTLAGERAGMYGREFGSALLVTGSILFFAISVVWTGRMLYATERDRDSLLVRERAARGRAEAALLARDQLLAVVSHELRTPLTPILLLAASLVDRDDLPDDVVADLRVIRDQVQAEAAVVSDLLDLVGLRQGKLRLNIVPSDLNEIIRAASAAATPAMEERRIGFFVELSEDATRVQVDRNRLTQVLRNLLDNAAKFTPPGGSVTIRCTRGEHLTPDAAVIEIQDTGVGIDPSEADRIFDEFEQADRSTTRAYGGLGLGLTISRMLVSLHGGTLTVSSPGIGHGATFRVLLPAEFSTTLPTRAGAPASRPSHTGESRKRLLLVEDHNETRQVFSRLLKLRGYDVTTASTADEAMQLAQTQSFDLLISDIGLPDVSGWELMRRLSLRNPMRGIAVSGFTSDEDHQRSRDAGYLCHLSKPIEVSELIDTIERISKTSVAESVN